MSCMLGGSGYCPQVTFSASTNRVSKVGSLNASYDAAGNMTGDGTHTYQWDAEDRMVSMDGGSSATYKYNSLGQRVERFLPNGSWTFDYQFGLNGEELGIYSAGTAAWFDQHISMGGRVLVDYGSPTRILHANNLGTTTVVTDPTGAELEDQTTYPWGQTWSTAGLGYDRHFAGMRQPQDAGLSPTPNRDYTPSLGRWMTPDPLGGDVSNPQSLNRYVYALNNPTSNTDPSGLFIAGPRDDVTSVDLTSLGNVGVLTPQASEHGVPAGGDSSSSTSQTTSKDSPCQGGQKGISPVQGEQILKASQQFFHIPYDQQDCSLFVCNSINASNVLPDKIERVTAQPSSVSISLSKDFKPVPASEGQVADIMVFSNPKPYHMGFYVPDPPMPPAINPYETFLSTTEHIANQGVGGPRYLRPVRSNFAGSITYYRLQEPCHE